MPGLTLSTDIIVGFPGETEEDFQQTLSLLREVRFDWGYIFKYSSREGTPAARFVSHPEELIEERHQRCLAVLDRISQENRITLCGQVHEVLVEEPAFGRTRTNYRVRLENDAKPGDLIPARITSVEHATLNGVIIDGKISVAAFRLEDASAGRLSG